MLLGRLQTLLQDGLQIGRRMTFEDGYRVGQPHMRHYLLAQIATVELHSLFLREFACNDCCV